MRSPARAEHPLDEVAVLAERGARIAVGVQTFPGLVVAGPFGFSIRGFFEVEDEAQRDAPAVAF